MEIDYTSVETQPILGIRRQVPDPGPMFESAMPALFAHASTLGVEVAGAPLGVYYEVGEGFFDMAVAVPIVEPTSDVGTPEPPLFIGALPSGRVAVVVHSGSYDALADTWSEFMAALDAAEVDLAGECWEDYVVGPDSGVDSDAFRTRLVQPISG